MCPNHWRLVPRRIQAAVYATYRDGQCTDKDPSEAWHQAADAAIGYVAALEDQLLRPTEITALKTLGYGVREKNGGLAVERAETARLG